MLSRNIMMTDLAKQIPKAPAKSFIHPDQYPDIELIVQEYVRTHEPDNETGEYDDDDFEEDQDAEETEGGESK